MQTLALTRAPVIASHSAVRAICNHSRNLDDEQLLALKQNGGVVQLVAFPNYVKCGHEAPERQQAVAALLQKYGIGGVGAAPGLPDSARSAFLADQATLNQQFPPPSRATVTDFVDHVDYAVKLIGIDHVGISSDFDGAEASRDGAMPARPSTSRWSWSAGATARARSRSCGAEICSGFWRPWRRPRPKACPDS